MTYRDTPYKRPFPKRLAIGAWFVMKTFGFGMLAIYGATELCTIHPVVGPCLIGAFLFLLLAWALAPKY